MSRWKNRCFVYTSTIMILSVCIVFGADNEKDALIQHAQELHKKIFTIDTHTDAPLHMDRGDFDIGELHHGNPRQAGCIDLPRMREGGMDAIFFAAFVGQRERTPANNRYAMQRVDHLIDLVKKMCRKYPDQIALALSPADGYRHKNQGLLSAYIGIENGFAIGDDLHNIRRYYNMGVRYITLCHTRNNDICDSSTDSMEHNGLSLFGVQVVHEMNRLGMLIDISHVSDASFYDAIQHSNKPIFASHSCARAICDNPRNLTDDMLLALARNRGVIQMCILSEYVKKTPPNPEREKARAALREKYGPWDSITDPAIKEAYRKAWYEINDKYPVKLATVADFVNHIDHVVDLIGVDYVGIGTDFDGGGGLADCRDVSQMPNITIELVKRGYSDEDIEKIWGGNFMRVFKANIPDSNRP